MTLRAFPVLYARDVEGLAGFYGRLGFVEGFWLADRDGAAGFIALHRDGAELGVVTEVSPRMLAGVEPGEGPRHEMFVYVVELDTAVAELRGAGGTVLREPTEMPWGERLAFLRDPEGNVVTLATAPPGGEKEPGGTSP